MTYQNDKEYLTNLTEYFVGVVTLAGYHLNTCFLLHIINQ
jgi:hypothetical protein